MPSNKNRAKTTVCTPKTCKAKVTGKQKISVQNSSKLTADKNTYKQPIVKSIFRNISNMNMCTLDTCRSKQIKTGNKQPLLQNYEKTQIPDIHSRFYRDASTQFLNTSIERMNTEISACTTETCKARLTKQNSPEHLSAGDKCNQTACALKSCILKSNEDQKKTVPPQKLGGSQSPNRYSVADKNISLQSVNKFTVKSSIEIIPGSPKTCPISTKVVQCQAASSSPKRGFISGKGIPEQNLSVLNKKNSEKVACTPEICKSRIIRQKKSDEEMNACITKTCQNKSRQRSHSKTDKNVSYPSQRALVDTSSSVINICTSKNYKSLKENVAVLPQHVPRLRKPQNQQPDKRQSVAESADKSRYKDNLSVPKTYKSKLIINKKNSTIVGGTSNTCKLKLTRIKKDSSTDVCKPKVCKSGHIRKNLIRNVPTLKKSQSSDYIPRVTKSLSNQVHNIATEKIKKEVSINTQTETLRTQDKMTYVLISKKSPDLNLSVDKTVSNPLLDLLEDKSISEISICTTKISKSGLKSQIDKVTYIECSKRTQTLKLHPNVDKNTSIQSFSILDAKSGSKISVCAPTCNRTNVQNSKNSQTSHEHSVSTQAVDMSQKRNKIAEIRAPEINKSRLILQGKLTNVQSSTKLLSPVHHYKFDKNVSNESLDILVKESYNNETVCTTKTFQSRLRPTAKVSRTPDSKKSQSPLRYSKINNLTDQTKSILDERSNSNTSTVCTPKTYHSRFAQEEKLVHILSPKKSVSPDRYYKADRNISDQPVKRSAEQSNSKTTVRNPETSRVSRRDVGNVQKIYSVDRRSLSSKSQSPRRSIDRSSIKKTVCRPKTCRSTLRKQESIRIFQSTKSRSSLSPKCYSSNSQSVHFNKSTSRDDNKIAKNEPDSRTYVKRKDMNIESTPSLSRSQQWEYNSTNYNNETFQPFEDKTDQYMTETKSFIPEICIPSLITIQDVEESTVQIRGKTSVSDNRSASLRDVSDLSFDTVIGPDSSEMNVCSNETCTTNVIDKNIIDIIKSMATLHPSNLIVPANFSVSQESSFFDQSYHNMNVCTNESCTSGIRKIVTPPCVRRQRKLEASLQLFNESIVDEDHDELNKKCKISSRKSTRKDSVAAVQNLRKSQSPNKDKDNVVVNTSEELSSIRDSILASMQNPRNLISKYSDSNFIPCSAGSHQSRRKDSISPQRNRNCGNLYSSIPLQNVRPSTAQNYAKEPVYIPKVCKSCKKFKREIFQSPRKSVKSLDRHLMKNSPKKTDSTIDQNNGILVCNRTPETCKAKSVKREQEIRVRKPTVFKSPDQRNNKINVCTPKTCKPKLVRQEKELRARNPNIVKSSDRNNNRIKVCVPETCKARLIRKENKVPARKQQKSNSPNQSKNRINVCVPETCRGRSIRREKETAARNPSSSKSPNTSDYRPEPANYLFSRSFDSSRTEISTCIFENSKSKIPIYKPSTQTLKTPVSSPRFTSPPKLMNRTTCRSRAELNTKSEICNSAINERRKINFDQNIPRSQSSGRQSVTYSKPVHHPLNAKKNLTSNESQLASQAYISDLVRNKIAETLHSPNSSKLLECACSISQQLLVTTLDEQIKSQICKRPQTCKSRPERNKEAVRSQRILNLLKYGSAYTTNSQRKLEQKFDRRSTEINRPSEIYKSGQIKKDIASANEARSAKLSKIDYCRSQRVRGVEFRTCDNEPDKSPGIYKTPTLGNNVRFVQSPRNLQSPRRPYTAHGEASNAAFHRGNSPVHLHRTESRSTRRYDTTPTQNPVRSTSPQCHYTPEACQSIVRCSSKIGAMLPDRSKSRIPRYKETVQSFFPQTKPVPSQDDCAASKISSCGTQFHTLQQEPKDLKNIYSVPPLVLSLGNVLQERRANLLKQLANEIQSFNDNRIMHHCQPLKSAPYPECEASCNYKNLKEYSRVSLPKSPVHVRDSNGSTPAYRFYREKNYLPADQVMGNATDPRVARLISKTCPCRPHVDMFIKKPRRAPLGRKLKETVPIVLNQRNYQDSSSYNVGAVRKPVAAAYVHQRKPVLSSKYRIPMSQKLPPRRSWQKEKMLLLEKIIPQCHAFQKKIVQHTSPK